MRRFLLLIVAIAVGGGLLYSFSSFVNRKANDLWTNWFASDSVRTSQAAAPVLPAIVRVAETWINPYEAIDAYAVKTPESKTKDVATLAAYLAKPAKSDWEKARAIFRWTAENISYDDANYNAGTRGASTAEAVLQSRKAVCQGFAELVKALCVASGLEAELVSGYSKGYGYVKGSHFTKTDHAWNAVKIDQKWRLLDATWGGGAGENVNGKLVSVKRFDDYWFDVDPYEMIFSHLPEDSSWQMIDSQLSLEDYERLPYLHSSFFSAGFDGRKVFDQAISGGIKEFVEAFNVPGRLQVKAAPLQAVLTAGEKVNFQFVSPDFEEMALINDNDWTHAKAKGKVMRASIVPKVGEVVVAFLPKGSKGKEYATFLRYDVRLGRKAMEVKKPV